MEISQDRLISMMGGFQYSKILLTAHELGVFRAIDDKPKTLREVSSALKLDLEACGILMGACVGLGLLTHKAGRFSNAPDVQKYLVGEGEESMSCIARHMNHLYESWVALDRIVRKGRPKKRTPSKLLTDRKLNRDFICGMFDVGYGTAKLMAEVVDLRGVKRMADIGGGPALYPIAFSAKNPDTVFTVADYPNTLKVARGYVRSYGLSKRIKLAPCRFFDVPELNIGADYDMALISQVLHAVDEEKSLALLEKTYRILRPGGRIIINENALNEDRVSPPPPLIFAVNMLINTEGRTYTVAEISGWLKEAGFVRIRSRRLHERSVMIEAVK